MASASVSTGFARPGPGTRGEASRAAATRPALVGHLVEDLGPVQVLAAGQEPDLLLAATNLLRLGAVPAWP